MSPRLDSLEVYGQPKADIIVAAADADRGGAAATALSATSPGGVALPAHLIAAPYAVSAAEHLLSQAFLTTQTIWCFLRSPAGHLAAAGPGPVPVVGSGSASDAVTEAAAAAVGLEDVLLELPGMDLDFFLVFLSEEALFLS